MVEGLVDESDMVAYESDVICRFRHLGFKCLQVS